MSVELEEIAEFLGHHEPFRQLPREVVGQLPSKMEITYLRRGEMVVAPGAENHRLYVIRSGAVDIVSADGILLDRREAGRTFGYSTLVGENPTSDYQMIAVEDCLLLYLGKRDFLELCHANPDITRYYSGQSARVRQAADSLRDDSSSQMLRTQLSEVMVTDPVTVEPTVTIRQAARAMDGRNVSSLLITDSGRLMGIITDRDLRTHLATGTSSDNPVKTIMTDNPRTATGSDSAFEAMLTMADIGIHHLPVVDEGKLTGIVSTADIMRLMRNDPIYLTADLARRSTPEELKEIFGNAHDVAVRFIERGSSAQEVTGLLTVAADGLARRLLTLAEEKLGPPPVPYCFVTIGSQGRKEIGLASDQDNALVLDNSFNQSAHDDYFQQLSDLVCDGLAAAGQVLCPGEMMAKNPVWRMTEHAWIAQFADWVGAPEPDAMLHTQTFFDFRGIHGETALAESVHSHAVAMAHRAARTHAHLAALASRREPPLGIFRGLVVDRSGDYANTLDVKKGGTAAIVQMARLYSLAAGVEAVGTRQRLLLAAEHGAVSARGAQELIDAFDFLTGIALQQQAAQVRDGITPNYHIDPKKLKKIDRETMRDAFGCIKSMQTALATTYPVRAV
ncbi:DUF294 nucleotidyltransferase-like domain-containing protein [Corynebacterium mendelii]|uniref:Cyclic nucleotide-binding/CBS domain-containing protein n=1 Tax=Corynebacterium mendelii TaxID=2765362 RepID=A0A939E0U7_9CORY|nr:DUF294 nucleotidyltransferase-like domain-containing protein [Corynebacterium mendelii]MBN9644623.1 cyclic nucleotide-binding/CBS domain-containing protein [Corynebacterium mendelii]